MEFDRMLAELFEEEDRARDMAGRLMATAKSSAAAARAERESLLAFLRGPMERHMRHEETALFPLLEAHGLGSEVQVAKKQHELLRDLGERLAAPDAGDDEVAQLVFDIARRMMHHTNFEGDYIYPELDYAAWRELMKATVKADEPPPAPSS